MKVLILAYDFPPLISIGAQRPYSWYKYLPGKEISVSVVTRQWADKISSPLDYVAETSPNAYKEEDSNGNVIIRAAYSPNLRDKMLVAFGFKKLVFIRKLLTYLYSFLEQLFFTFDSKAAIYVEAQKAIEQNKPDFIIATAEPFILFKYAHLLSARYDIPWVADYRDGWTTNQGNYSKGFMSRILNSFYAGREIKYVSNVSFITTASPTYAEALQKLHPNKKIKVIYNGFDEEYLQGIDQIAPRKDKFTIAYAGTIYPHQNLEMFLDSLSLFISKENIPDSELQVCFYGSSSQPQAVARLMNYNKQLESYIALADRIPYEELIKKLRAAHLLLLLSKKDAQWLNAKIFDYMAVKRKIFLIENDHGILENLLKETNSGISLNTEQETYKFLKQEYSLFKQGRTADGPVSAAASKYSRKNQANILSGILNERLAAIRNR